MKTLLSFVARHIFVWMFLVYAQNVLSQSSDDFGHDDLPVQGFVNQVPAGIEEPAVLTQPNVVNNNALPDIFVHPLQPVDVAWERRLRKQSIQDQGKRLDGLLEMKTSHLQAWVRDFHFYLCPLLGDASMRFNQRMNNSVELGFGETWAQRYQSDHSRTRSLDAILELPQKNLAVKVRRLSNEYALYQKNNAVAIAA